MASLVRLRLSSSPPSLAHRFFQVFRADEVPVFHTTDFNESCLDPRSTAARRLPMSVASLFLEDDASHPSIASGRERWLVSAMVLADQTTFCRDHALCDVGGATGADVGVDAIPAQSTMLRLAKACVWRWHGRYRLPGFAVPQRCTVRRCNRPGSGGRRFIVKAAKAERNARTTGMLVLTMGTTCVAIMGVKRDMPICWMLSKFTSDMAMM